jgi:hypothetical protein
MSLESACPYLLPRMSLYSVSFLPLQPVSRISLLVHCASHVSLFSLFLASAACLSNQPARTSCPACLFIQALSCLCSLSLESACSDLLPCMSLYSALSCLCSLSLESDCSYLQPRVSSLSPTCLLKKQVLISYPVPSLYHLSPQQASVNLLSRRHLCSPQIVFFS